MKETRVSVFLCVRGAPTREMTKSGGVEREEREREEVEHASPFVVGGRRQ